jgi:hypothetical protein
VPPLEEIAAAFPQWEVLGLIGQGGMGKLAEEHSALRKGSDSLRDVGDRSSSQGLLNDGFADQRYTPNHRVPSPEVEQAMKNRLKTFLKDNKIDPDDAQLELRYGK